MHAIELVVVARVHHNHDVLGCDDLKQPAQKTRGSDAAGERDDRTRIVRRSTHRRRGAGTQKASAALESRVTAPDAARAGLGESGARPGAWVDAGRFRGTRAESQARARREPAPPRGVFSRTPR